MTLKSIIIEMTFIQVFIMVSNTGEIRKCFEIVLKLIILSVLFFELVLIERLGLLSIPQLRLTASIDWNPRLF